MTYAPWNQLKVLLFALLVCVYAAQPPAARAQAVRAEAQVNSNTKGKIGPVKNERTDGKGVSIAAAKVFTPEREDYRVSGAPGEGTDGNNPANANELPTLQALLNALTTSNPDIGKRTQPTKNPARFTEIDKITGFPTLLAKTDELKNTDPLEIASALATQRAKIIVEGGLPVRVEWDPKLDVKGEVDLKSKNKAKAAAFGVNRDPLAIEWDAAFDRLVSLDLSELSLVVETSGAHSSAFAFFGSDASFINGTLDIELPEDDATPLYEFSVSALSLDGGPAVFEVTFETFGNHVFDSLGNQGLDNVRNGLLSQLALLGDGSLGFQSPYSFTVRVPEEPLESVLFLREVAAASAEAAIPEPSTMTLVGVGLVGVFGYAWCRWMRTMWALYLYWEPDCEETSSS